MGVRAGRRRVLTTPINRPVYIARKLADSGRAVANHTMNNTHDVASTSYEPVQSSVKQEVVDDKIKKLRAQWKAANKRYRERHPERRKEQARRYNRLWRQRNPQKVLENVKKWQLNNPEKHSACRKKAIDKWRKKNAARVRETCRLYRIKNRDSLNEKERARCVKNPSYKIGRILR